MRILLLKPSSLGDVIHALPVLRLLKLHYPASEIHWWIRDDLQSLLEGDPDLAGRFVFERSLGASLMGLQSFWRVIQRMRAQPFDWVIDLQSLARSSIVAWLANGVHTIGLDDRREGGPAAYDFAIPRPSANTHAVDWYLQVLPYLNVPIHNHFEWLPKRPAVAQAIERKWSLTSGRWILLQPGARWLNKRWPIEHFAELVRRLAPANPGVRFAVLGSAADKELGAALTRANPNRCLDLTGQLTGPEMIEWIRAGDLMISNDTGPMHVAAALRKPVFGLFGPTNPLRTGPYGQWDRVQRMALSCAPCMKSVCRYAKPMECLRALSPAMITPVIQSCLDTRA